MMRRRTVTLMLGMVDPVQDQLACVITVKSIVNRVAIAPRVDKTGQSQLGQMLGYRRCRLSGRRGELSHRHFTVLQAPEERESSRVGEHPENFDGEVYLIRRRKI